MQFNNTTSYPLLLIGALDETGILKSLMVGDESTSAAIERAKSYCLGFATVSSCLTFAVGPRLIDSEHAPEDDKEDEGHTDDSQENGADGMEDADENTGLLAADSSLRFANPFSSHSSFFPTIRKPSSNPKPVQDRRSYLVPKKHWIRLGPRTKWWFVFISDFFNAPMMGAIIGTVIGLVPALKKAFFADSSDGGIFTAWLTASLKNIGGLFVTLPVVVAGVSLFTAYQESRRQPKAERASLPKLAVSFILFIRFVIWPALSISVVYALASRTQVLSSDPMLWFTMMLMPTGPSAMKLVALVQVSNAEEGEEASIAKMLTVSSILESKLMSGTLC
jgi:hypothetical protein